MHVEGGTTSTKAWQSSAVYRNVRWILDFVYTLFILLTTNLLWKFKVQKIFKMEFKIKHFKQQHITYLLKNRCRSKYFSYYSILINMYHLFIIQLNQPFSILINYFLWEWSICIFITLNIRVHLFTKITSNFKLGIKSNKYV